MVTDSNQTAYESATSAAHYAQMNGLWPAEELALRYAAERHRDGKILDLGVGGGRTTPAMLAISGRYVGVDYAENMISVCRGKFPSVRFETGDARDLLGFGGGELDFVLFSFNGIDYVSHEDRVRVLREVNRVLRVDGTFIFSSHNALHEPRAGHSIIRKTMARLKDRFVRRLPARVVECAVDGDVEYQYRIQRIYQVNHVMRTYHIAPEFQRSQLGRNGFSCQCVIDLSGHIVVDERRTTDPWLYYIAQKAAVSEAGNLRSSDR